MASCQGQVKEKVYPFSAKAFLTSFVFFCDTSLEKISNKMVFKERVGVLAIAFAVTRERIRQIEAKALAKLRKHKDAKKLYEYLD